MIRDGGRTDALRSPVVSASRKRKKVDEAAPVEAARMWEWIGRAAARYWQKDRTVPVVVLLPGRYTRSLSTASAAAPVIA